MTSQILAVGGPESQCAPVQNGPWIDCSNAAIGVALSADDVAGVGYQRRVDDREGARAKGVPRAHEDRAVGRAAFGPRQAQFDGAGPARRRLSRSSCEASTGVPGTKQGVPAFFLDSRGHSQVL